MEYRHSKIVNPALYETQGLCDGIDVRMHTETDREDRGAIRAHQDWNQHVSPIKGYKGTLGPKWSFMTVSVPECLPERLEVISYANEFAFLHDGTLALHAIHGEADQNRHYGQCRSGAGELSNAVAIHVLFYTNPPE